MERKRIFYLDFIRVLCTFLIVVYHFPLSLSIGGTDVLHATANGRWGVAVVYVFFMLSGAALFYRYRDRSAFSVKQYYKRRFLSIYPLFYLAYVFGFLTVFWLRGRSYEYVPASAFWLSLLGIDTYFNAVFPTFAVVGEWFIGAIVMIYVMFPPLYFFLKREESDYEKQPLCRGLNTRRAVFLCGILLIFTLLIFYQNPLPLIEVKANLAVDLFFFLLGALIGTYAEEIQGKYARPALIVSGLFLFLWCFVPLSLPGTFLEYLKEAVSAVMLYIFLAAIARPLEKIRPLRLFCTRLSGYTYGVFLIHHLTESRICAHFDTASLGRRDTLILLLLCLIAVAAAAWLLYFVKGQLSALLAPEKTLER